MPVDYSRYPDNWHSEIRPAVLERDNHKCRWCGVDNYAVGARGLDGKFYTIESIFSMSSDCGYATFGTWETPDTLKIVLTIAHLGIPKFPCDAGDKHDKMDCRLNNLVALCQKCHLNFDRDEHAENRRKTLAKKQYQQAIDEIESGQPTLFNLTDYVEQ